MFRKTRHRIFTTRLWVAVILAATAGFAARTVGAQPSHPEFPVAAPVPSQPAAEGQPSPQSVQVPPLEPPSLARSPVTSRWYGYQIMLSDAAAVALIFSGVQLGTVARYGSVALYGAAPPVIHVLNKGPALAGASLLLCVVLPVLGAVIGANAESCGKDEFLCPLAASLRAWWSAPVLR